MDLTWNSPDDSRTGGHWHFAGSPGGKASAKLATASLLVERRRLNGAEPKLIGTMIDE